MKLYDKINRISCQILKMTNLDTNSFGLAFRTKLNMLKFSIKAFSNKYESINLNSSTTSILTRQKVNLPSINKNIYFHSFQIWCRRIYIHLKNRNVDICKMNIKDAENIIHLCDQFIDKELFKPCQ